MDKVNKLILQGVKGRINRQDVLDYCDEKNIILNNLYNELAIKIAKKFDSGELPYFEADRAINSVFTLILEDISEDKKVPEPAYSIYEVFDEGEYDHGDDADPVEKFTKPLIKEILKNA